MEKAKPTTKPDNFEPIRDDVVVELIQNTIRDSGLYVPDKHGRDLKKGKVKKTGPKVDNVDVGEIVWFKYFKPVEFIDGSYVIMLPEGNILLKQ